MAIGVAYAEVGLDLEERSIGRREWTHRGILGSILLMIASRTLLVTAMIATLCIACGHDKRAMKTVTARASFDLSCPQDELELTVLSTAGARKLASQIGVSGCGKKVVYVYFSSTDSWIADSAITPAMTKREEAYKEQKAREDQAAEQERSFEQQQTYQRGVSQ
jgi:hypothetical protein